MPIIMLAPAILTPYWTLTRRAVLHCFVWLQHSIWQQLRVYDLLLLYVLLISIKLLVLDLA